jgi:hypothetical protein
MAKSARRNAGGKSRGAIMKNKQDSYLGDVSLPGKINDIPALKATLIAAFDAKSQDHKAISRYSVLLGTHVLEVTGVQHDATIDECFAVNEQWQAGTVPFQAARNVAGRLLRLAREEQNPLRVTVLRVMAQVANTPHVKRHALIASDYAIKAINVLYPHNSDEVRRERETQIALMESV